MTPDELNDAELREALPGHFRLHVIHQSGAGTNAPETIFADADYEFGGGTCGLHEDDKYANEPAIVYVRADLFMAERAHAALRAQAETVRERDRLAAWQDAVLDAVQADLEHGVKPLNEAAAKDFQKRFPNLCAALARAGGDAAQEDTQ